MSLLGQLVGGLVTKLARPALEKFFASIVSKYQQSAANPRGTVFPAGFADELTTGAMDALTLALAIEADAPAASNTSG